MKRPPFFLLPTLGLIALTTACGKDKDIAPNLSSTPVITQNPDDPLSDDLPPINNTPLDPLSIKKRYTVQIKAVNDRLVDGYTKPIYVRPGDIVSLSADLYDMKSGEAQFRNNAEFSWKAQGSRDACHGYNPRTCLGSGFLVDHLNGVNFIVPYTFVDSMELNVWWSRNDYRVASITLIAIRDNRFDPFFGLFPRWNPEWDRDGKGTHWNRNWDRNWNRQWDAPRERRWWKKERRRHVTTEPNPQFVDRSRGGNDDSDGFQNHRALDRRDREDAFDQEDRGNRRSREDRRREDAKAPEIKKPSAPELPREKGSRKENKKTPNTPLAQPAPQAEPKPVPRAPVPAPAPTVEKEKSPEAQPERKPRGERPRKEKEEHTPAAPQEPVPAPNPPAEWIEEAPAASTPTTPEPIAAPAAPESSKEETSDSDQSKKPRKQR